MEQYPAGCEDLTLRIERIHSTGTGMWWDGFSVSSFQLMWPEAHLDAQFFSEVVQKPMVGRNVSVEHDRFARFFSPPISGKSSAQFWHRFFDAIRCYTDFPQVNYTSFPSCLWSLVSVNLGSTWVGSPILSDSADFCRSAGVDHGTFPYVPFEGFRSASKKPLVNLNCSLSYIYILYYIYVYMIMYVYYYNIVDPCVSHSRKYPNGPNVVNTKKILTRHKPTIWGGLKSHPSMVILGIPLKS
jgi:hypothetical protein